MRLIPKIHVDLPPEIHQKLRVLVALQNSTIQEYVAGLLALAVREVRAEIKGEKRSATRAS